MFKFFDIFFLCLSLNEAFSVFTLISYPSSPHISFSVNLAHYITPQAPSFKPHLKSSKIQTKATDGVQIDQTRRLPDFLQSVNLKYLVFHPLTLCLVPLIVVIIIQPSQLNSDDISQLWLHLRYNLLSVAWEKFFHGTMAASSRAPKANVSLGCGGLWRGEREESCRGRPWGV